MSDKWEFMDTIGMTGIAEGRATPTVLLCVLTKQGMAIEVVGSMDRGQWVAGPDQNGQWTPLEREPLMWMDLPFIHATMLQTALERQS